MNKTLAFLAIFMLLSVGMVTALTPPSADAITYYNFSSVTDLWGSNDATNVGATSSLLYPTFNVRGDSSPNSYLFDGVNDKVTTSIGLSTFTDEDFSINIWAKIDSSKEL
jgi:hypothetical protein